MCRHDRRSSVPAGVRSLEFDLVGRRVRVRHDLASPDAIEAAIRELGMRPSVVVDAEAGAALTRSLSHRSIIVTAVAGVLAIGSEVAVIAGADEQSVLSRSWHSRRLRSAGVTRYARGSWRCARCG